MAANQRPLAFLCAILVTLLDIVTSDENCPSYCNAMGYYVPSVACSQASRPPAPYCCGNLTTRFCCNEASADISLLYPDTCFCSYSNCVYRNWEAIVSVVTMSLLFVLILGCCCINRCQRSKPVCASCVCCRRCPCSSWAVCQRCCVESTNVNVLDDSQSRGVPEMTRGATDIFDPNNPYAFTPPDYDSLSKDPPKYEEIELEVSPPDVGGQCNSAFINDTSASPPVSPTMNHRVEVPAEASGMIECVNGSAALCDSPREATAVEVNVPMEDPPPYSATVIDAGSGMSTT